MPQNRYFALLAPLVLYSAAGLIGCNGSDGPPPEQIYKPTVVSAAASPPTSTRVPEAAAARPLSGPPAAAIAAAGSAGPGQATGLLPATMPDKDNGVVKVHVYYGTDRAAKRGAGAGFPSACRLAPPDDRRGGLHAVVGLPIVLLAAATLADGAIGVRPGVDHDDGGDHDLALRPPAAC